MPLVDSRPLTPGQRFLTRNKQDVSKKKPERLLTTYKHSKKGRNCYGRITSRRRGGGHKRAYRIIDFRRGLKKVTKYLNLVTFSLKISITYLLK
mgnify:CR=1 FL=1